MDRVDFLSPYGRELRTWEMYVTCPAGCDPDGIGMYQHLRAVAVNRGGEVVLIEGEQEPRAFGSHPTGRGSSVWIEFQGECGHRWVLHYQFHKGQTFYEAQVRGVVDDPWDAIVAHEFWRT